MSTSGMLAIGWGVLALIGWVLLVVVLRRRLQGWHRLQERAALDPLIADRLTKDARKTIRFLLGAISVRLMTTTGEILLALATVFLSRRGTPFTVLSGLFAGFLYATSVGWIVLAALDLL